MDKYLNEKLLGVFLNEAFSGEWIHNKTTPNVSGVERCRPDYRSDCHGLIIEFDGPQHYTKAKQVIIDRRKDAAYRSYGYTVVRVPYFIQLSVEAVETLFSVGIECDWNTYEHGFIESGVITPSDYCSLGLERFEHEMLKFKELPIYMNSVRAQGLLALQTGLLFPRAIENLVP